MTYVGGGMSDGTGVAVTLVIPRTPAAPAPAAPAAPAANAAPADPSASPSAAAAPNAAPHVAVAQPGPQTDSVASAPVPHAVPSHPHLSTFLPRTGLTLLPLLLAAVVLLALGITLVRSTRRSA